MKEFLLRFIQSSPRSDDSSVGYRPIPGKELPLEVNLNWNKNLEKEVLVLEKRIAEIKAKAFAPCMLCRHDGFACDSCGSEVFFRDFEAIEVSALHDENEDLRDETLEEMMIREDDLAFGQWYENNRD